MVIRNSSDLHQSPLEFPLDVNTLSTDSTVTINLEELPQLSNFQNVSVKIKVTDVHDVVKVKDLTKQEYSIADATSTPTIVVWEDSTCWHFKRRLFIQVIWLNSPHVSYLGDCTRCGVTQKIETCKLRFHARVDLQSEGNLITVTALTLILENICQTDDVTKAALLTSTPFNATINNIVTSISH